MVLCDFVVQFETHRESTPTISVGAEILVVRCRTESVQQFDEADTDDEEGHCP